jgi:SAM-dependent methyltransferase
MPVNAKDKFLDALHASLRDGTFVKVTLGDPRGRDPLVKRVFARRVKLAEGEVLSLLYRQATKDVTKNFPFDSGVTLLIDLIGAEFRFAHLQTTTRSVRLEFREGRPALLREEVTTTPAAAAAAAASHDQPKQRIIDAARPWLRELGVTASDGKVAKGMEAKFRQINRFVELVSHLLAEVPDTKAAPLHVVDMGCGKGYLTFGVCDWLRAQGWKEFSVRGIEARPDLVELCNRAAVAAGFGELKFEAGTIAEAPLQRVDLLIALHACDTATDDAIARGVAAGARFIIVSPCCHKEVRPQLTAPPVLAGALRHGILKEREAEFVTDALRAALLEWAGYDTKVLEFISTEHTSKNLMIAAVKRARPLDRTATAKRVRELAAFYGVKQQRLAERLGLALTEALQEQQT